jgi:hypothetical protein
MGTLGAGTVFVGTGGVGCVVVGSVSSSPVVRLGTIASKIAANLFIACILSVPGCLKGVVGAGFLNAWVRSNAALVAASVLESPGTLQCFGKKSTVSLILSCPVVEQYTLCAR